MCWIIQFIFYSHSFWVSKAIERQNILSLSKGTVLLLFSTSKMDKGEINYGLELSVEDTASSKPTGQNGIIVTTEGDGEKEGLKSVDEMTDEEIKKEKFRIMRNILLVSVAFLFNFTSFGGLSRLQSSLHQDQGMGTTNQAVLYAGLVVSCLFLPKIAIQKLGHKWCISVSILCYILWMGANGIGRWWSMTPTSVLVGLAAAPLWTAQCSYFTLYAVRYADLSGEKSDSIVSRFFGIFFFFFQMCKY